MKSQANSFSSLFGISPGPTDLATCIDDNAIDKPVLQKQGTHGAHVESD